MMSFAAQLKRTSDAAKVGRIEAKVEAEIDKYVQEQIHELQEQCQARAAEGNQDADFHTSRLDTVAFFKPGVSGDAQSAIQAITSKFEAKLQCLGFNYKTTARLAITTPRWRAVTGPNAQSALTHPRLSSTCRAMESATALARCMAEAATTLATIAAEAETQRPRRRSRPEEVPVA
eukprot:TRINITY_DN112249_c0_g1_i1.p1 TRINITY_DN112249_c0_g1~~TRINITY_DN112249_c0_g1_i1.p1  ORF type:complete len:176 (-),score=27.27 TRINITY_DN112249_c0_g1_i1:20-547(-)